MKILWTKSPNPVDWLISAVTGEDCGHMALLFEAQHGTGVVFESNLLGCHPAFLTTWMKRGRRIIHEHMLLLTTEQEDALWELWVSEFDGKGYDLGGALFLGLMKLRRRLFGTPLPERNRWAKRSLYFCDEVYQLLAQVTDAPHLDFRANGMSTPHDVWLAVMRAEGKR